LLQFLRRPSLYEPAGGWLTPRIHVDPPKIIGAAVASLLTASL